MKHCLLLMLLLAASAAQAQKLPIPGEKNPDWVLRRKEELPETRFRSTDPMPNAGFMGPSSNGSHYYYWDSKRQLRYEWESRPNDDEPTDTVLVREVVTGTAYMYRRASPLPAPQAPRQWRRIPGR